VEAKILFVFGIRSLILVLGSKERLNNGANSKTSKYKPLRQGLLRMTLTGAMNAALKS
jgi:hypothetical protein